MNVYDGLVRYKMVLWKLSQLWQKAGKLVHGKTYTFDLRTGIKFHDGSSFDADAVKFNFR